MNGSVMRGRAGRFAGLVMVVALGACAGLPGRQPVGQSRDAVLAQSGPPTARYNLSGGGERLQYSQQPSGPAVYNLDFDAAGRLVASQQALELAVLYTIERDRWIADDVLRLLGQPAQVSRVARFQGDVWSYRFLDQNNRRQVHIHLDPQGVVRLIQYTDEEPRRDPWSR